MYAQPPRSGGGQPNAVYPNHNPNPPSSDLPPPYYEEDRLPAENPYFVEDDGPSAHHEAVHHNDHQPMNKLEFGKEIDYNRKQWNDIFWAILFVVQLIAVFLLLGIYFDNLQEVSTDGVLTDGWKSILLIVTISGGVVGLSFAIFFIYLVKRYASEIIKVMLALVIAFHFAAAVISVLNGSIFGAVILVLFGFLFIFYAYLVRDRIPFAKALLEMSSQTVQDYPNAVTVAFAVVVPQVGWVIVWAMAVLALGVQFGSDGWSIFVLLLSFFWTAEVLSNIVHVTDAGVAATWYFNPEPKNPTWNSLKRALTTSFGSICFGSLIVAVVQAVRVIVYEARRRSSNAICLCFVQCILRCLQDILEYVNHYAFVQVAIYGKSYCNAAKDTWQLFKARGIDALINDNLSGYVLFMGAFLGGVLSAIIGGVWAHFWDSVDRTTETAILSFLFGFVVVAIVMNVIRSFIATYFVCFAEDPSALYHSKPEAYDRLVSAISVRHPTLVQSRV